MRQRTLTSLVAGLCATVAICSLSAFTQSGTAPAVADTFLVYFGSYTAGSTSKGIYVSRFTRATGALSPPVLAAETWNPTYLAVHPSRRYLYAVNEVTQYEGAASGAVSAFAIEPGSGTLAPINSQPSRGTAPAHITIDGQGRYVLAANYNSGSVVVLPIGSNGALEPAVSFIQHAGRSIRPRRQTGPHAHSMTLDATSRFAYAADLGLDQMLIYRFDAQTGALAASTPPFTAVTPGAGPRHFAIHPQGRFAYVINELDNTIIAFTRDPQQGTLTVLQTVSSLPAGDTPPTASSAADVQVHPSGKFLYGSNRGHDTIVVFAIDQMTGRLTLVEHESTQGKTPRGFGIDPSGTFLLAANQDSNSVVVFRIDPQSGALTPTGEKIAVGAPVCVKFVAAER
jgi:6-phosphogluconolactonase